MTARFRKKPVVIEAQHFTRHMGETVRDFESRAVEIARWCGGRFDFEAKASDRTDIAYWITIPTLEGNMRADVGDWIIRGVKGEFYPCKPDIFEATYEPEAGVA